MGTELGEAFIPIRALLDKLDGDLASARKKTEGAMSGIAKVTSGISKNLQTVGKVALGVAGGGIAAVGAALLTVGRSSIQAASNLNEAMNASKVVFGDAAGIIQDFGKTAAETTGLSAEAFNQMGAQMGALLQNMGLDEKAAAESTINLTQRAADMASIFNTDVSDAFLAVQAGLRGETEPLRRFGVDVSDAAVQAYALANGLIKEGQEMDNTTKITARMALVYEQTNKIAGDFVNTSDGLANAARIQQARWQNFKAELGGKLLPVVQTFQGIFMTLAATVLPRLLTALGPVFTFIQRGADAFASFVSNLTGGMPFLDALTIAIMKLFGTEIGFKFYEIAEQVGAFFQRVVELLAPIWEAITGFVSWKDVLAAIGIAIASVVLPAIAGIIAAAAPLIAALALIVGAIALLRNAWENDWGGIRTALTNFWENTAKPALAALVAWLQVNIPIALQYLADFWTNVLQPAIQAVWGWISGVLIPYLKDVVYPILKELLTDALKFLADYWTNFLLPAITKVWAFIKDVLIPIFVDVIEWLATNIPTAIRTAQNFWDNTLQPAISRIWQFISGTLIPVFLRVSEWLITTLGDAIGKAKAFWESTLYPAIYDIWQFIYNDLLPVFRDVAIWLAETVVGAIKLAAQFWSETLWPALEKVWKFISEDLLPIFNDVATFLRDTLKGIIDGIAGAFNGIRDAVKQVIEWVGKAIEELKKIADAVPDWLIPGSPTEFEIGIRGVGSAFKELQQIASMPLFGGLGGMLPAMAMTGADTAPNTTSSTSYTSTTTIYTNRDPLRVLYASRHLDKLGRVR